MKRIILIVPLLVVLLLSATISLAAYDQIVAGAGPSTKIVEVFFVEFNKKTVCEDYHFEIMPTSIKHKGGILSATKYLFGRTGRPLSSKEKSLGKEEILLGKVPISFAVGLETGVKEVTLQQIKQIFTRQITNWKELGGKDAKIVLIGREQGEAIYSVLQNEYPEFNNIKFDKIFKKDHEIVKVLGSPAGAHAVSFGARPNFKQYNLLEVKGFSTGVALGLVYDLKNRENQVIKAASKYASSPEWKKRLAAIDMLPVN